MHGLNVKEEFLSPLRQVLSGCSISNGSDTRLYVMPVTPCNARRMIHLK